MRKIRSHLTYANVVATLALVLAVAGGTAAAATYVVSSNSQVGPDTISGHSPRTGQHANIVGGTVNGTDIATAGVVGRNLGSNSVNGSKVTDGSLTGADIADRTGVDTCPSPLTVKLGPTCAGSDAGQRDWFLAVDYCAGLGLRLPSLTEAIAMAQNYDVPGISGNVQAFWTDSRYYDSVHGYFVATTVAEDGSWGDVKDSNPNYTVCVTDPSA